MNNNVQGTAGSQARWKGWFLFSTAVFLFFYQFFARVSVGILKAKLTKDLGLTSATFALLASSFHHAYAPMQIPAGMILDRFSLKSVLLMAIGSCALGCFIFGMAQNLPMAYLGRFLIGFGAAFGQLSSLKAASSFFSNRMVAVLNVVACSVGMLGAVSAGLVLPYATQVVSWHALFFYFALVGLVLLLPLVFLNVKGLQPHPLSSEEGGGQNNLKAILKNPLSWAVGLYACFAYAPFSVLFDTWGTPLLQDVYNLGLGKAALIATSLGYLGFAFGGPVFAKFVAKKGGYSSSLRLAVWVPCLLFVIIINGHYCSWLVARGEVALGTLFFLGGAFASGQSFIFNVAFNLHPLPWSGTVAGVVNAMTMVGGGVLIPSLTGFLLGPQPDNSSSGTDTALLDMARTDISSLSLGDIFSGMGALNIIPVCLILGWVTLRFLPKWSMSVERQLDAKGAQKSEEK